MIVPIHFQSSSHTLFGVHHAPEETGSSQRVGVVLCPPIGKEYMRTHRVFFELAEALSREGFDALRFDYFATGDSEGTCQEGTVQQWVLDIGAAVGELRSRSMVREICLIGHRLGGALAALHCLREKDIKHLALSRPVLRGDLYTKEILLSHKKWLDGSFADSKKNQTNAEFQGFPLTEHLKEEFSRIDLTALSEAVVPNILAIAPSPAPEEFGKFIIKQKPLAVSLESRVMSREEIRMNQTPIIVSWLKERAQS